MNLQHVALVGFLVMIGYFAANLIAGVIMMILTMFLPFSGELSIISAIISLIVFAFILGIIIVWLLAKFAK